MESHMVSTFLYYSFLNIYDAFIKKIYQSKKKDLNWILTFSCHTQMWQVAQNKKKNSCELVQKNQSFTPIKQLYMLSDIWRLNDCLPFLSDMKNCLKK